MRYMKYIVMLIALIFSVQLSFADETITAPAAFEKVRAGEIVLIDIRRPAEWRESGIASVATPLSMHQRGFLKGFQKIKQENPGKKIALICATGGRSSFLQKELKKRGFGETINVSEGMYGNGTNIGWIRRKLPLSKFTGN